MHTENQLPMLPGSALKVPGGVGGVGSYPFLGLTPTPVEVELGCDNSGLRLSDTVCTAPLGPKYELSIGALNLPAPK